jgi:uncharacterized protein YneF (UPF0154 family)
MWIHGKRKLLRFSYAGHRISLKGVKDQLSSCPKVKARKIRGLLRKGGIAQLIHLCQSVPDPSDDAIPPTIQQVVDQHSHLFKAVDSLPAERKYDHQITLVPRVKPVNIKPYRYSPGQKDEIERQIQEMLSNGIIKPDQSPFASPVIQVKKKDGSWRF